MSGVPNGCCGIGSTGVSSLLQFALGVMIGQQG